MNFLPRWLPCLGLALALSAGNLPAQTASENTPVFPPAMSQRTLTEPSEPLPGTNLSFIEGDKEFILFIPHDWKIPASGELSLLVGFQIQAWHLVQEDIRRGGHHLILAVHVGEGTPANSRAFEDPERFGRLLKIVEEKVREKSGAATAKVTTLDFAAYGGGYGAIRTLLKDPDTAKMVQRLVLCDAMYASYDKTSPGTEANGRRKIDPAQMTSWLPMAQAAAEGKKTFVLTHSQILPGSYASTLECGLALAEAVGAEVVKPEVDSSAAANDENYALLTQADKKHFHVWGYNGVNNEGHATHLRHLGDIWKVLDQSGAP